ncbi:MAG TPA: hypothetical protein VIT85_04905 [Solirubrobacterales bacterium]
MDTETFIGVLVVVAAIAVEATVYALQVWWHDDPGPKKDPRNGL